MEAWIRPVLGNANACRLLVRAQPGARREGLVGLWNGRLKLAVRVPPSEGRANESLAELIALALDLRPSSVQLVVGAHGREKEFLIPLPLDLAQARVQAWLAQAEDPNT